MDEGELRRSVALWTTPGEPVRVPESGAASRGDAARGRAHYLQLGCHNCHGTEGHGAPDLRLFDEQGEPTTPRDLAHELFKGGLEPPTIYLRIAVGMPGTPHPASPGLTQEQTLDLVDFCRSLAREPRRSLTNDQRAVRATLRGGPSPPNASGAGAVRGGPGDGVFSPPGQDAEGTPSVTATGNSRYRRWALLGSSGALACVALVFAVGQFWSHRTEPLRLARPLQPSAETGAAQSGSRGTSPGLCGDCHAVPLPQSFHRDAWYDEVRKGYQMYALSGRTDLTPPPIDWTTAYYRAAGTHGLSAGVRGNHPVCATFKVSELPRTPEALFPPATSHLRWLRLDPQGPQLLLLSDLRNGQVAAFDPCGTGTSLQGLGTTGPSLPPGTM